MLDQATRAAILRLREAGHGSRAIARVLKVSRHAVKAVLRSGSAQVPLLDRKELAAPHHERILELHAACKGHLERVHEELVREGATLSYQALTGYCRRHGIGHAPKPPAGRYEFAPGQEMQHDTSPHEAVIAGVRRKVQTASLVFCYSRMIFFQIFPRFSRLECKAFLTDALRYFGGACARCMTDNTHVIVHSGTGANMVPAPEMEAFAERYDFTFVAHELGDANRSARVEGPFDWIENNFLNHREFSDWEHLNREAVAWCDKVNAKYSTKLRASRRELFAAEVNHLKPFPIWVPPVYQIHSRIVDLEGYVSLHGNRYSVPWKIDGRTMIGHMLEVRETKDRVEIYDGPREIATHIKVLNPSGARVTEPQHRPPRGEGRPKSGPPQEEVELLTIEPRLSSYVAALKMSERGRGTLPLRGLLRLVREYEREPLLAAVAVAEHYRLFAIDRLERLVLREIARAGEPFFRDDEPDDDEEDGDT
jgi:transposase